MWPLLLLALAALVSALSKQDAGSLGVYWGRKIAPGEFPFLVSIADINPSGLREHYCGGAIVSQFYVMTAGHCVVDKDLSLINGCLNDTSRFCDTGIKLNFDFAYVHPNFSLSGNGSADVALLHMVHAHYCLD
jgi:secreted trypsin-like serine protease